MKKEYAEEAMRIMQAEDTQLKYTSTEVYEQYRNLDYWRYALSIDKVVFEKNIGQNYDNTFLDNVVELFYYDGLVYSSVLEINEIFYIKFGFDYLEERSFTNGYGLYTHIFIPLKSDYDLYLYLSQKASIFDLAKGSIIFIHEQFTGNIFNDIYKEGEHCANNYYYLNSNKYDLKEFFSESNNGIYQPFMYNNVLECKFLKLIYEKYNGVS